MVALARRGAAQETRKAANTLAKAIRLGRTPKGLIEDVRGDCMEPGCRVSGRRFRRVWFEQTAKATAPHLGNICSSVPKCVLCTSRELGVV